MISLYFNPPTPCGVGLPQRRLRFSRVYFNPPTPCGVGPFGKGDEVMAKIFQSTHPLWGGTPRHQGWGQCGLISIHPPLVGWDAMTPASGTPPMYFNPPTPCGVGPDDLPALCQVGIFQSTHPLWGGTGKSKPLRFAPYFNPPTPCGVGPVNGALALSAGVFQSTHPLWGGTFARFSFLDFQ